MTGNPILVQTFRDGVVESFHRGAICVVNHEGEMVFSAGDPEQMTFPRSALKFFQQIPLVESGAVEAFGITDKELAVMCGSHNGEAEHVRAIQSILSKIGLDEGALQCGPQYPTLGEDRRKFYEQGMAPKDIHNNCSGKHAGFLTLSRYWGASVDDYLDYEHTVQKAVRKVIAEMHELSESDLISARDGCSAPIFAMSIFQMATGYKNLVRQKGNPHYEACQMLIKAVQKHPHMLAGRKRYCTELMENTENALIGKTGAEGIFSLGFPDQESGATIKIDDGKMGPQYAVAQKLIKELYLVDDQTVQPLDGYIKKPLRNWNKWEVGSVEVNPSVFGPNKD